MTKKQNVYTGRSGQAAVMAEFLRRGYNAAVPAIDVGEDIYVVRDSDGRLWRVQVKSSIAKGRGPGGAGTFAIPMAQLEREHTPEQFYLLAAYRGGAWGDFLVIRRDVLLNLRERASIGNVVDGRLILYVAFTDADAVCSGVSLQAHRDDWSEWPIIEH